MAAGLFTSIALVATACGGGGGNTTEPGTSEGTTGGEITIRGCTPQNPLLPGNTSEVCGGNVLDAVGAKLVHYNADTAAPEMDIAQSIETTDNQTFTVKLKPYKFQDGTDVTAKSFVDAWNYTAYFPNGQGASYFFTPIEGYADLQPADAEGKAKPKTDKMTGLKVIDDTTFTIKTSEPVSNLPVRLGYTAFSPLPESFFKDPVAYGKKPIGAGPFQVESNTATEIVLSKFADYSGANKPNVDKVTFRIYNDANAAYNDTVANNLDFTDLIPADQLVGDAWKSDLDGRNALAETGIIQTMTYSPNDDQFKNNVDLRKAISMAINRPEIVDKIFTGTRVPATGWVSPVVDGYKPDVCGTACNYDAAAAKALYDKAGGYQGTLTLSVNGDGGHKPWADAACNSIKNALGLDCIVKVTPDFKTLLDSAEAGELKGVFRSGWQMDYPSIENFLAPLYGKGADSNYGKYDNPKFDAKLKEAAAAKTTEEANTLYQEAEAMLATDMAVAPLWYTATPVGWSDKVTDVKVTPFSTLDLSSIKLK
ncbi:MAG: ABC transporter substrate-binding protein [Propionibacteriaceae bacterium]